MLDSLIRKERGWAGHFICADRCLFRRNTLLTCGDVEVVVSTVGLMANRGKPGFEQIGYNRYFETMVFHSDKTDTRYHDIDATRQVTNITSDWYINEIDADDKANDMHEAIVEEIASRMKNGERFEDD